MPKLFARRWRRPVQAFITAAGMAFFMSGVITALNTGLAGDFVGRWMHSFVIAVPLAFMAAYLWAPIAARITDRIVEA